MQKTMISLVAIVLIFSGWGCAKKEAPKESMQLNDPNIVIPTAEFVPSTNIEKYKDVQNCEGREDWQDCYANRAILTSDPSLCLKMEAGLDDLCLQYYYLQKDHADVCKTLPKKGIVQTCKKYYENRK